ncbi:MAG: hypothetical protein WDO68_19455 [Gammaproteobacteria bacterium]
MPSKMLDRFVQEIGLLLNAERWDEAEQYATGLPHVAIALSSTDLKSSQAAYRQWCSEWLQPDQGDAAYDAWYGLSTQDPARFVDGKPVAMLQALSLVRRLRANLSPPPRPHPPGPRGASVSHLCGLLIAAFQTWHSARGRTDPTVALNLAKLGVLR